MAIPTISLGDIITFLRDLGPHIVNGGRYVVRQVTYGLHLKEKYEKLKTKETELLNKRTEVNSEIARDKVNKEATPACREWLQEVKNMEDAVEDIISKASTNFPWLLLEGNSAGISHGKCSCQSCVDFRKRRRFGKLMVKQTQDIEDRIMWKSNLQIVQDATTQRVQHVPTPGFAEESSMDRMLHRVLTLIRDSTVSKIGIWGMLGIGKTCLMENLNNLSEHESQFDKVFLVPLPEEQSDIHQIIKIVQHRIVEQLKLNIENNTEEHIRGMIHRQIAGERYLLLLDNVSGYIDLQGIGLVEPDESNGCKLVLATRDLGVCRRMKTSEEIEMKLLEKEEAWKLFLENVGTIPPGDDFKNQADAVFEECGNLPKTILAIGQSLSNEQDLDVWKHIHNEMVSPTKTGIGPHEDLIKLLMRVSYDKLDNNVQNCFLFSALFCDNHDIHVDYLIQCWKGEGLLDDNLSFAEAHAKGRAILKTLKQKCFLTDGSKATHIRMHETYRDLALHIMSHPPEGGHKFLVKAGLRLTTTPGDEVWEGVERISLMHNNLIGLPERPNCSGLLTLFLQHNEELNTFPPYFFINMSTLRILDISGTMIADLPSLSSLSNLRDLYLENCSHLVFLPENAVEHLIKLELLDIRGTGIRALPVDIGQLTSLQCLQVSTMNFSDAPNQNVAMFPVKLEEVIVDANGDDGNWKTKAPKVIDKIIKLTTLNALHFDFPDINCFEKFINSSSSWKEREWRSFTYMIGVPKEGQHHRDRVPTIKRRNGYLTFAGGSGSPSVVKDALQHADAFELLCHSTVSSLSDFRGSMNNLRSCGVSDCKMIDSIFVQDDGSVNTLEELYLKNLEKLQGIWKEPKENQRLENLKFLHFENCRSLVKVFTVSTFERLPNLKKLHVESCQDVVEIIGSDEVAYHVAKHVVESKLMTLVLTKLPKLSRFYKEDLLSVKWVSLEEMEVSNCSGLQALHLQKLDFSGSIEVRGNMEWWNSIDWPDESTKKRFRFNLLQH